jgi:hypothetical protein
MYIPGRLRTASRPFRTCIFSAVYSELITGYTIKDLGKDVKLKRVKKQPPFGDRMCKSVDNMWITSGSEHFREAFRQGGAQKKFPTSRLHPIVFPKLLYINELKTPNFFQSPRTPYIFPPQSVLMQGGGFNDCG